jgi:hypothetical protein
MKHIKLHVTDLDSYRWYRIIDSMTIDEMRGRLLRTEAPNDNMLRGTAWHSILENPPSEITSLERDGWIFNVNCDCTLTIPSIREIRVNKRYHIGDYDVTITGKCDGITGNQVDDHKLTFRPNPENYLDAYQWRAYLDLFNADVFRYIVYAAKSNGKQVNIYDVSELKLYRYPSMVDDLILGIKDIVGFIEEHVPEMVGQ